MSQSLFPVQSAHARHAAHRSAPRAQSRARKLLVGQIRREGAARNRRGVARRQLGAPEGARRHRHSVERFLALRSCARHQRDGRCDPGYYGWNGGQGAARNLFRDGARRARSGHDHACAHGHRTATRRRARAGNDQVVRHQLPLHGAGVHAAGRRSRCRRSRPVDEYREAKALGYQTRPVLLGPVTYLKLGKSKDARFDPLSLLGGAAAGLYRCAAPARRQRRRMGAARRAVPRARPRRSDAQGVAHAYGSIARRAAAAEDHADDLFRRPRRQSRYRAVAAGRGPARRSRSCAGATRQRSWRRRRRNWCCRSA